MEEIIELKINEFENYLGFSIKKQSIPLELNQPHDEHLFYNLSIKFYDKKDELNKTIKKTKEILNLLIKTKQNKHIIETYYSLLGNLYYINAQFNNAAGCFMKCLTINKNDITSWIELLFTLRCMGKFKLFEKGIFNFEKIYKIWQNDSENTFNQKKFLEIIKQINF
ncbi:hypothetical protein HN415_01115 [Candidatus Woesearchaeota archaeon]|jgi:tetratricopeptide (TPR) repeat protein|nr:hypothetical protein [Candidatus Woesearchaeota archaeon]